MTASTGATRADLGSSGGPGARRSTRTAIRFGAAAAGLLGAAGASVITLVRQAHEASSSIETAARTAALDDGFLADGAAFDWQDLPPNADGVYLPDGTGPLDEVGRARNPAGTRVLVLLGDSTSVGYGCATAEELPAVVLARGAAARLGRPIRIRSLGVVGAVTADLDAQVATLEAAAGSGLAPDAVAIMIGANDVRDLNTPRACAAHLASIVRRLRARGIAVVVGTCPDLGVITPIRQPLRRFAGVWSRALARAQERAVARAGGVPVALARLVSPEFHGHPDLFYADGFHPSGQGYAKATAALLPAVVDALR